MADIFGTDDPEALNGTSEADSITGEGGNDTLTGNGGADTLRGGDGDDVLTAGDENNSSNLDGGDGNDAITVTTGDAFIQPGAGDDTITGSDGDSDFNEIAYIYDARDADPVPTNGLVVVYSAEGAGTVTDYAGGTDTFTNMDAIRGTQLADTFNGADGDERFSGLDGNDTFDGGGGTDEIDYWWSRFADGAAGVAVNLENGTATDPFGDTDTLISIEDIRGTDFGDTLIGDDNDNQLRGGEGDDSISGAGGDDDLRGGKGNDTVEGGDGRDDLRGGEGDDTLDGGDGDRDEALYENTPGAINGNLTTGVVTDGWGDTDTLIDVEEIRGGDFDDVLFGGTGFDSRLSGRDGNDSLTGADDDFFTDLNGGDGNDTLDGGTGGAFFEPGAGDDVIIGGTEDEGFYGLSYIFDTFFADPGTPISGITVTFTSERDGTVIDFNGDTDTFEGIDRIRGTNEADSFTGADGEQQFRGFGGDDFFDGGAGDSDLIDYSRADEGLGASQGIVLDMANGTATDAYGDTDTFVNIERIRGTDFDDVIIGDDQNNNLVGEGGNDSLLGGGGDDYLRGGAGNDTLEGGDGNDFFENISGGLDLWNGGEGEDTLRTDVRDIPPDDGQVLAVDLGAGTHGLQGGSSLDTLVSIENFEIRGDWAADIKGDGGNNNLRGDAGNDTIAGLDGDDDLDGGAGDDQLDGGAGTDTASYDAAQNSFTLTLGPSGMSLMDRQSDGAGTDQISNMEFLYFDDSGDTVDIRGFETLTSLSTEAFADLIELYIAYFNRAPDAVGLYFWGVALANGTSLEEIATSFIDQEEIRALYPEGLSNEDLATTVYSNVLGRAADQAGFDFWVDVLDSGAISVASFVLEFLKGAKADPQSGATQDFIDQQLADRQYLSDKTDVGAYFAVHKGMSDVDNASAALAVFDGSDNSIAQAVATIDGFHTDALDAATGEFLVPLIGVIDDPFAVA